ncbi:MAG: nucleoside recognition domain-containing protein [bacterium]
MAEEKVKGQEANEKVEITVAGVIALLVGIVIFSGLLTEAPGIWKAFDFTVLTGSFGKIVPEAAAGFRGSGGTSVRDGFVFAFTLGPAVMLALGLVSVIEHLGGLKVAQAFMTPLLRPLMGIPGVAGLTLIAALQSSDAAAAMTRGLRDTGLINQRETNIFASWQFPGGPPVTNYFTIAVGMFPYITVPIILPLVIQIIAKFVVANVTRFVWDRA